MRTVGSQLQQTTIDDISERIKIIYYEKKRNKRGDIVKGDEKIRCEVYAKIYPYMSKSTDGRELELTNEINYRVTIRYREDIKPDDEIIWGNKRLKIKSPAYDIENRHIYTAVECVEVVADGI